MQTGSRHAAPRVCRSRLRAAFAQGSHPQIRSRLDWKFCSAGIAEPLYAKHGVWRTPSDMADVACRREAQAWERSGSCARRATSSRLGSESSDDECDVFLGRPLDDEYEKPSARDLPVSVEALAEAEQEPG
jgi:hypothetical protein